MNEYFDIYSSVIGTAPLDDYGIFAKQFEKRQECLKKYSFAIPDEEAIEKISKYSPIIEIGAGSGYWSFLLKEAGVDVEAYDDGSWGWDTTWTTVLEGGPDTPMGNRNLFLCWPNYSTPFAYNCLKNFKGKYFIYIGEGSGGCTGDDDFHGYLDKNFKLIDDYELPQWFGIHDRLCIFKRKKAPRRGPVRLHMPLN